MIFPVLARAQLDITQIEFHVRIQVILGELLKDLAFDLKAFLCQFHPVLKAREEIIFGLGQKP